MTQPASTPIYVWRYTLRSRQPLNALNPAREHPGALVKIGDGVGCLHPRPELDDLPLERQLSILVKDGFTSHLEKLRVACKLDAAVRQAGRNAFTDFDIPPSHSYNSPAEAGGVVKIKGGPELARDPAPLRDCLAAKLRLDFNQTLTVKQFLEFVRRLDDATLQRIDFVEDPFDAHQLDWDKVQRGLPFDLASDRAPVRARVAIVKPACDLIRARPGRVVFTSYMDHPIGQLFAAREAAAYYAANPQQEEVCGLASHTLFEPDEFIERLRVDAQNRLLCPPGPAFGFDDLLEKLPWEKLA